MQQDKERMVSIEKQAFSKSEMQGYEKFINKLGELLAGIYLKQYAKSAEGVEDNSTKSVEI